MCPDRETLSAFFDNEIEDKFTMRIKNHIENCTECRNKLAGMESCSRFLDSGFDDVEIPKNRVWNNIQNELDRKNVPDIWHRRIIIPLPVLAAASFFIIMLTALLSTLLATSARSDYLNFTVTEAVNIKGDNPYYFLENDQTVNVELQLPEDAFFVISGTPQLIREVDYLQTNE